jgi:carotenoid cleavage dioxygenase-like enzyme
LSADKTTFHCTPELISPANYVELPRINYKFNGKKYKNYYAVCVLDTDIETLGFSALVKVNTETHEETYYNCRKGEEASEPVFVARPGGTDEEDGVVLTSVVSRDQETSTALVCIDPKTMKEIARAEFRAKGPVTKTFHGQFIGKETIHLF